MVVEMREFDRPIGAREVRPVPRRDSREDFDGNSETRVPLLLLLDTSSSMELLIEQLTNGTRTLTETIAEHSLAAKRAEVAIITFGGGVYLAQEFATVDRTNIPKLSADGTTPMASAILRGLHYLEERQKEYRTHGVASYRPFVFLLTDGEPTDTDLWDDAVRRVKNGAQRGEFYFFPIGVGGDANLEKLAELGGMPPKQLDATKFSEMFRWIGKSTGGYSISRKGDTIKLEPTDSWSVDLKVH